MNSRALGPRAHEINTPGTDSVRCGAQSILYFVIWLKTRHLWRMKRLRSRIWLERKTLRNASENKAHFLHSHSPHPEFFDLDQRDYLLRAGCVDVRLIWSLLLQFRVTFEPCLSFTDGPLTVIPAFFSLKTHPLKPHL